MTPVDIWRAPGGPTAETLEALELEFPMLARLPGMNRRTLLRVMGASLAMAGLTGCKPERSKDAVPYVTQPEGITASEAQYYATAVPFDGWAQPALATAHVGRPTRLDGNPEHPASRGKSDAFLQAAVLDLYDPDRSQAVLTDGAPASWAAFDTALAGWRTAWARSGGAGVRLVLGPTTSPTLIAQLARLRAAYPKLGVVHLPAVGDGLREAASVAAFGKPLQGHVALDRARTVVAIDDDLLGPGPRQVAQMLAWATRRGDAADRQHLYVAEPTPTLTGAAADTRRAVAAGRLPLLVEAIAAHVGIGAVPPGLDTAEAAWAVRMTAALRRDAGAALLAVGPYLPPATQALGFAVNDRLGNSGRTLWWSEPIAARGDDLDALAADLAAGRVDVAVALGCNPVYDAPALPWARARLRLHAGSHVDETARASRWHLPLHHALEAWSDGRAVDGTATLTQPLVDPLYDTRSLHGVVAALTGDTRSDRAIVRASWPMPDAAWRRAVHDGFTGGAAVPVAVVAKLPAAPPAPAAGIEAVFRPDPTIWDGARANNAWLQELPKPLLKTVWDNVVGVSAVLAAKLGLANGDMVRVAAGGRHVDGPAWVLPGQAAATVTLFLGHGRTAAGQVGNGVGYDAGPFRGSAWTLADVAVTKLDAVHAVATMQMQQAIDGPGIIRVVKDARGKAGENAPQDSLYPALAADAKPNSPPEPRWGMVIDLDKCTGCGACTVACQSENNIPVVGRDQVARGRVMHWLRVDRYHSGPVAAPRSFFQPVPCMHCEQAPCETGCPVHATVHGPDGVNEMVYNRCIGTRTCSSYCPYKVRRFNWLDYTGGAPASVEAQRNPDVTVRARGVMEKCTYCIQRIRTATVAAARDDRAIGADEVVTACQSACPSGAIKFGDLNDPRNVAAVARKDPRNYAMLEHLGVRPRTTYLARIVPDEEA